MGPLCFVFLPLSPLSSCLLSPFNPRRSTDPPAIWAGRADERRWKKRKSRRVFTGVPDHASKTRESDTVPCLVSRSHGHIKVKVTHDTLSFSLNALPSLPRPLSPFLPLQIVLVAVSGKIPIVGSVVARFVYTHAVPYASLAFSVTRWLGSHRAHV